MAKTYQLVRVTTETYDRIVRHRGRLQMANEMGGDNPLSAITGEITLDTCVSDLLDRVDDHRARDQKSKAKKRSRCTFARGGK